MKPEYYNPVRNKMGKMSPLKVLNTGVSIPFATLVEAITSVEDSRVAHIVFEGLVRVIKDRFVDSDNRDDYLSVLDVDGDYSAIELVSVLMDFEDQ